MKILTRMVTVALTTVASGCVPSLHPLALLNEKGVFADPDDLKRVAVPPAASTNQPSERGPAP